MAGGTGASLTAGDGIINHLKKTYTDRKIQLLIQKPREILQKIRKTPITEGVDNTFPIPLTYGTGFGSRLNQILANQAGDYEAGSKLANVTINTANDYFVIELDNKWLRRGAGATASFVRMLEWQVDSQYMGAGVLMSGKLFGDGSGALGASTITVALNTLFTSFTLTNIGDVAKFEVGMRLSFSLAGVMKIKGSVGETFATVAAINEDTGVITLAGTGYSFSIANADKVGMLGVYDTAGPVSAVGIAGWIPLTQASGTTIGNASIVSTHDRGVFIPQLQGHRINEPTRPVEESMFKAWQRIHRRGGQPNVAVISHNTYLKLAQKSWSKIVPVDAANAQKLGNTGLMLATPGGMVPIRVEVDCPDNLGYLLTMETWEIVHLSKGLIEQIMEGADSNGVFATTYDSRQTRYRIWWNVRCVEPIRNAVFAVNSAAF